MPIIKEGTYKKTERPKNSIPPGQREMKTCAECDSCHVCSNLEVVRKLEAKLSEAKHERDENYAWGTERYEDCLQLETKLAEAVKRYSSREDELMVRATQAEAKLAEMTEDRDHWHSVAQLAAHDY